MREEIGDYIICDRDTARKVWNEEPEKRHRLYLPDEFKATLLLSTADMEKIEKLKLNPKGFVYKKGMVL